MPISTETEIQGAYQGEANAKDYVDLRFRNELMRMLHERQVTAVNCVMETRQPARTLEIATGPGRVTRDIRPAGKLIGLEFNDGMIDEARQACGNGAEFVQGNAFELPFGEDFDFVYTFRFVRHFKREDRGRLYQQIHQVLRPGGRLVLDAVNAAVSGPLREQSPEAYPVYDKLYKNEAELVAELESEGFSDVRLEPVQKWYAWQYKAQVLLGPRSRTLCRWAIRSLERLSRGPALEWIVTCRRA